MLNNLYCIKAYSIKNDLLKTIRKLPVLFPFWVITVVLGGFISTGALAQDITLPKMESGKVVLPWKELKSLLEQIENLKKQKKVHQSKKIPPAEYTITRAQYNGIVEDQSIRFEAGFSIEVLKDGWVSIPFFPNTVGIEMVNIGYEPSFIKIAEKTPQPSSTAEKKPEDQAIIIKEKTPKTYLNAQFVRSREGYQFIARGTGKFTIDMTFYISLDIKDLVYSLNFTPPRSVINQITLRIPQSGAHLIHAEPAGRVIRDKKETLFKTVLRTDNSLSVRWKIEKDTGITRKKQVTTYSLISIDKSMISAQVTAQIKHVKSLNEIAFHLPLATEIVNVTGSKIDQWHVEQTKTNQIITISGQPDRHSGAEIVFSYRLPLPATLPATVKIPVMYVHGADNMTGYLGIEPLGNIEITTENTDKDIIISARNLPKKLWHSASSPILHGYKFHTNTFNPGLTIKSYHEIQTIVANVDLVDSSTYRTLAGKSVTRLRYFIRNNDRQFLTLKLPGQSHIWQAFLDGKPVKPARKETGEILIPMKKSPSTGEFRSFLIEVGYITDVSTLSLKGDITNQLPGIDIPISYLRWTIYLPDYYGYSKFEGPLKQVKQFSNSKQNKDLKPLIKIPAKGQKFLFEKFLIVNEVPYVRAKYGQYLGNDIFLSTSPGSKRTFSTNVMQSAQDSRLREDSHPGSRIIQKQIIPNQY